MIIGYALQIGVAAFILTLVACLCILMVREALTKEVGTKPDSDPDPTAGCCAGYDTKGVCDDECLCEHRCTI